MKFARKLRAALNRIDLASHLRAEELEPRLPPGDVLFGGLLARSWLDLGGPTQRANPASPHNDLPSSLIFMGRDWPASHLPSDWEALDGHVSPGRTIDRFFSEPQRIAGTSRYAAALPADQAPGRGTDGAARQGERPARGAVDEGIFNPDAGVLDVSLVNGSLDDLVPVRNSGTQEPVGGAADDGPSQASAGTSRAAGDAVTGGSVSSPDLPPRDVFSPVASAAGPVGHADDLEAQTLLIESRHGGSQPPPPPIDCTVTGGHGLTASTVEGQTFTGAIANFSASSPQCTFSDFSATVSNDPSAFVSPDGMGGFDVVENSHLFMEEGTFPVTVDVMDHAGTTTTFSSSFVVVDAALRWANNQPTFDWSMATDSNQSPTFTSTPDTQHTAEGAAVRLQLQASDPDHDRLTFGAVGLPPGLSISSSGLISGTMDYAAAEEGSNNGNYTVTAVVADGHGNSANESFNWVVTDTPQALVLPNPGDQTNAEGDSPWFDLSGSDPDGNPITYTATGLPPGVTLDPDSGLISGQISPTAASASPYTVTATISDGIQAHNVSQTFRWTVTHLGLTNPGNQANVNGDTVSLQLRANDVDGDILTYGVASDSALPPGLGLDTHSGLITGTLGPNADSTIPYTVKVTAGDGIAAHTVTQTFTWTVAHLSLVNPGNQANAENDTITNFQLQGHDADGETLTYTDNHTLPTGLSIVGSVIQGQIQPNAQTGAHVYPVTITASDGHGNSANQTFTWTVTHVLLTSPGDQNTGDGDAVSLQLHAHDNDDPSLTYSDIYNGNHTLPPGLTINAGTGLISGTMAVTADANSPYTVTVTADDASMAHLVSQTFNWSVFQHVQVTSPNDRHNADGDIVNLPIQVLDPEDGDPLTYSDTSNGNHTLPPGLMLDQNTGLITGTLAGNADVNSPYTVMITATDAANSNYSASQSFHWTVSPVGLANPGAQYNADGDMLIAGNAQTPPLQLQGRGTNLMYRLTAGALPHGLTLAPNGLISGTILPDADTSSPYTATVTVTDGAPHSASQTFTWTVTHLSFTNPGNLSYSDGDNVNVQLQGHDSDTETISYQLSSSTPLPHGLNFTSSGLISGTLDANADAQSPYTLTVTASDGIPAHNLTQTFTLTVGPRITITPPGDQLSADGDPVTLQIAASDAAGHALTYSLSGQPGSLMIDNTGKITGNIGANDDVNSPYLVTVTAGDDKVSVSQQFLWSVVHILVTPPGDQSNVDGDTVALPIQARHTDMAPVTFSATGLPPNLSIDSNTGIISGKISHTADAGSPYSVTVQATENDGYSAGQTFTWTVSPLTTNAPANQSHVAGSTVSLPIRVRYNGTTPLTFSATGLPPGLAINRLTGVISGRITPASVWRRYNAAVTVTDGAHPSNTTFTWTVLPPGNQPPTITNPGNQVNNEDDDIALPIQASDPDGDPLTYSATGLPSGLSIDPASGWITGSVDDAAYRDTPFQVTVTVDDGNGNTASQTFSWLFEAPGLTASPMTVAPLEGVEFSGMVASFTNANVGSSEFADEYEATIDWGDGNPLDTGTVTGANGSYQVLGNHLYQTIASRPVTVTITDESLASVTVTSTASVGDAPVTATGVPVSLLVGSIAMVPVATFTDLNPYDPITSYSANIDWGDGHSSSGSINGLGGKFVVSGGNDHSYTTHGTYTVGVTIKQGVTTVATTSTTATAGDYYEGQFTLTVTGFTDDNFYYATAADFTPTVQWGDGTSDNRGTIMYDQGSREYFLTETHTYGPGVYNVTVTINDDGGSSITATAPQPLYIAEQPLMAYTAPVSAAAGIPLNNATVALFTDPDPSGAGGSGSATLDWGDGSSGQGAVSASGGIISVTGSHTYAVDGTFPVAVSFRPTGALLFPVIVQAIVGIQAVRVPDQELRSTNGVGVSVFGRVTDNGNALGKEVFAYFRWNRGANNRYANIAFLQVVLESYRLGQTPNGPMKIPVFPTDAVTNKPQTEIYKKYATKANPYGYLDFQVSKGVIDTAPYYDKKWTSSGWAISTPPDPKRRKIQPFSMYDTPHSDIARTGNGVRVDKFETVVFCIDTQEVLGTWTWGFTIPDNRDGAIQLDPIKFNAAGPSANFQELIQQANKVGAKGPMLHARLDGKPMIAGPTPPTPNSRLLGGTSAIPVPKR